MREEGLSRGGSVGKLIAHSLKAIRKCIKEIRMRGWKAGRPGSYNGKTNDGIKAFKLPSLIAL